MAKKGRPAGPRKRQRTDDESKGTIPGCLAAAAKSAAKSEASLDGKSEDGTVQFVVCLGVLFAIQQI